MQWWGSWVLSPDAPQSAPYGAPLVRTWLFSGWHEEPWPKKSHFSARKFLIRRTETLKTLKAW